MKSSIHSRFSTALLKLKSLLRGLSQYAEDDQRNLIIRINGRNRNFVMLILSYCILLQVYQIITNRAYPTNDWHTFGVYGLLELCLFSFAVKQYFFHRHIQKYRIERRLHYAIALLVSIGTLYFSAFEIVFHHSLLNYIFIAMLLPMVLFLTLKEVLLIECFAVFSTSALFLFFDIPSYLLVEILVISIIGTIISQIVFHTFLRHYFIENELSQMNEKLTMIKEHLEVISKTDDLTQLSNRYELSHYLLQLFDQSTPQKVGAILLDVDSFKSYNDYYGHIAGDDCLRQLAQYLKLNIPYMTARYGGEEFIIIVENQEDEFIRQLALKIREDIEQLQIPIYYEDTLVTTEITISIGAVNGYFKDERTILNKADYAMYEAKRQGRNCAVIHV